jgi:hypothetical protein
MSTNLAGGVAPGEFKLCYVRANLLTPGCAPSVAPNSQVVSTGAIKFDATPEIEAGAEYAPKGGCGKFGYIVKDDDRIKYWGLSGEFMTFDYELMFLMFGGTLQLGKKLRATWPTSVPASALSYGLRQPSARAFARPRPRPA